MEENELVEKTTKPRLHSRKKIELPIETIISEFENGTKQRILAKRYDISDATISRKIDEYYKNRGLEKKKIKSKLERQKREYPEAKKLPMEEVIEKFENGTTQKELARQYKVTYTTIRKKLKRYYKEHGKEIPLCKRGQRRIEIPIKEVIEKYENGISQQNLAKQYNVSIGIISKRINEYYKENGRTELPIDKIIQDYENGYTQAQLSQKYKMHQSTISNKIREYYNNSDKEKPIKKTGPKEIYIPIDDVIRQFENGVSQVKLARDYNVNVATIVKRIDEYYQSQGELKPRILISTNIIVEYIEKGLTIEQILKTAENRNIIIPHHFIEKAIEKVNAKNINDDADGRG